jgi:hypothetical protein
VRGFSPLGPVLVGDDRRIELGLGGALFALRTASVDDGLRAAAPALRFSGHLFGSATQLPVEEELLLTASGLQHLWRVASLPAGAHFEVEIDAAGLEYQHSTDQGLLFAGPRLTFTYGHATWIDARGERTAVPARWNALAQRIVLSVPAEVVARSAWPAVLDPELSAGILPHQRRHRGNARTGVYRRREAAAIGSYPVHGHWLTHGPVQKTVRRADWRTGL